MAGLTELSPELQAWATRCGLEIPQLRAGAAVQLWADHSEERYLFEVRDDGWVIMSESWRYGPDEFMFAGASQFVLERHLFAWCGSGFRSRHDLAQLTNPDREQDLHPGYRFRETEFAGRTRMGLVDPDGQLIAISAGAGGHDTADLVRLSKSLHWSTGDIMRAYEDPDGRPLFELWDDSRAHDRSGDDFMAEFAQGFRDAGGAQVAADFTIVDQPPAGRDEQIHAQVSAMVDRIAQELAYLGPDGWLALHAEFSSTVRATAAQLHFTTPAGDMPLRIPEVIVGMVRQAREAGAAMTAGPWWRLILTVTNQGRLTVSYDYGQHAFPTEQLQPADNYRADIAAYPRLPLPAWLATYIAGPPGPDHATQASAIAASVDHVAPRPTSDKCSPEDDFGQPMELRCVLNPDATMNRMTGTLIFQALFAWLVTAFAIGLFLPKQPAVGIVIATIVSAGSVLWVRTRTRDRLRKTYGQLQRLVLDAAGLHRYDGATRVDIAWNDITGFQHRNSSLPGTRVRTPSPIGFTANRVLRDAHTVMTWGIVGVGALSPLPGASSHKLKVLDRVYHSSLSRGKPIRSDRCLIFPSEFEHDWTGGMIGRWLRHHRPDLTLPRID